ncbi:hypothetical protein D3C81_1852830 [compost metagenome]
MANRRNIPRAHAEAVIPMPVRQRQHIRQPAATPLQFFAELAGMGRGSARIHQKRAPLSRNCREHRTVGCMLRVHNQNMRTNLLEFMLHSQLPPVQ